MGSVPHWLDFKNDDLRTSTAFKRYGVKTKRISQYAWVIYSTRQKKVNTATLPYPTFTFTYLLLPYPTLPLHTHTATLGYPTATFLYRTTTAYCCVNSAAVAVRALNEYDYSYINVLLFKAHCLPRAVQCCFVAGLYSAL